MPQSARGRNVMILGIIVVLVVVRSESLVLKSNAVCWNEALRFCRLLGGQLAVPSDPSDLDGLDLSQGAWVGVAFPSMATPPQPVTASCTTPPWLPWSPWEPLNPSSQRCVYVIRSGGHVMMKTRDCGSTLPFICSETELKNCSFQSAKVSCTNDWAMDEGYIQQESSCKDACLSRLARGQWCWNYFMRCSWQSDCHCLLDKSSVPSCSLASQSPDTTGKTYDWRRNDGWGRRRRRRNTFSEDAMSILHCFDEAALKLNTASCVSPSLNCSSLPQKTDDTVSTAASTTAMTSLVWYRTPSPQYNKASIATAASSVPMTSFVWYTPPPQYNEDSTAITASSVSITSTVWYRTPSMQYNQGSTAITASSVSITSPVWYRTPSMQYNQDSTAITASSVSKTNLAWNTTPPPQYNEDFIATTASSVSMATEYTATLSSTPNPTKVMNEVSEELSTGRSTSDVQMPSSPTGVFAVRTKSLAATSDFKHTIPDSVARTGDSAHPATELSVVTVNSESTAVTEVTERSTPGTEQRTVQGPLAASDISGGTATASFAVCNAAALEPSANENSGNEAMEHCGSAPGRPASKTTMSITTAHSEDMENLYSSNPAVKTDIHTPALTMTMVSPTATILETSPIDFLPSSEELSAPALVAMATSSSLTPDRLLSGPLSASTYQQTVSVINAAATFTSIEKNFKATSTTAIDASLEIVAPTLDGGDSTSNVLILSALSETSRGRIPTSEPHLEMSGDTLTLPFGEGSPAGVSTESSAEILLSGSGEENVARVTTEKPSVLTSSQNPPDSGLSSKSSENFPESSTATATQLYHPRLCPCRKCQEKDSGDAKELGSRVGQIVSELAVGKEDLSVTRRKLTSAPDRRTSSKTIGFSGAIALIAIPLFVFVLDLPLLVVHVRQALSLI